MARAATLGAALLLVGVLADGAAAQQRGFGQHGHFGGFGHGGHGFLGRHGGRGLVVVAPFVPLLYASPSLDYYYPPPPPVIYYKPPPVYYGPPQAYGPPAHAPAPPSAPTAPPTSQDVQPTPREVVFPTGRWVLQGDGVAAPYRWVWIPNPPTAPPAGASGTVAADAPRERPVYAWTDANGVTTYTDRLSRVPPEHRAGARRDF